jgi:S-adenosyl methyltransferase
VNSRAEAPGFDTSRPHPARMYDYLLGGKDNYEADRAAAEKILADAPEIRANMRANRAFLHRAVRHLARDRGITQFLDIGTGVPTSPNVHETAAAYVSCPAVLYADNDPVIRARANALLARDGITSIVLADLRAFIIQWLRSPHVGTGHLAGCNQVASAARSPGATQILS